MLTVITTENVNREGIEKILSSHTEGYTLVNGTGIWKGAKENSLLILIAGPCNAEKIAYDINKANKQKCCMVIELKDCRVTFP